jgi:TctA family transporter
MYENFHPFEEMVKFFTSAQGKEMNALAISFIGSFKDGSLGSIELDRVALKVGNFSIHFAGKVPLKEFFFSRKVMSKIVFNTWNSFFFHFPFAFTLLIYI